MRLLIRCWGAAALGLFLVGGSGPMQPVTVVRASTVLVRPTRITKSLFRPNATPATAKLRGSAVEAPLRQGTFVEAVLYSFHNFPRDDGAGPWAGLIADKTGALYGTTFLGGENPTGTVFKLTPSKTAYGSGYTETVLHIFQYGSDGSNPQAGLLADKTGALYGTTPSGGKVTNSGTVFKLTPSETASGGRYTERVLHNFGIGNDGSLPLAGLVTDKTGALYGTTALGGGHSAWGTVFKLTPSETASGIRYTERVLHVFHGYDGASPTSGLIADEAGALYGTTAFGGISNNGTVFKLTPLEKRYTESVLYNFGIGNDGAYPSSGLLADKTGAFYGTTSSGGVTNNGIVFRLAPSETVSGKRYIERVLHSFHGRPSDGAHPRGNLIADETGALYGTTVNGGSASDNGTVFKLTPSKGRYTESILHRFQGAPNDGAQPMAGLIADETGALYGTTFQGGGTPSCQPAGCGTVFKLTELP